MSCEGDGETIPFLIASTLQPGFQIETFLILSPLGPRRRRPASSLSLAAPFPFSRPGRRFNSTLAP